MKHIDENAVIRQAMGLLGARKTEKKAAAARQNGSAGGRPPGGRPLSEITCTCAAGPAGADDAHAATCPRGRAFRRRQKKAETLPPSK